MKNKIKKLLHTTAVRLSLKYSLLYILILAAAFLTLYWFITGFVQDQMRVNLTKESAKVCSIYDKGGFKALKSYMLSHEQFKGEDHKYYLLVDKNGQIIAGDLKKWPSGVKVGKPVKNVWVAEKNIVGKVDDGDGFWPMVAVQLKNGSKILIAQGIKGTEDLRETLFTIMAVIFALIVILMLTLGLSLGKSMLQHTNNIENACKSIIGGDLSKRISISDKNDEFDTISKHINGMLDELERFITQSKETSNSIAHDLRTPLNRIRNKLEMILLKGEQNTFESLENIINDIDKMTKMINSLLEISQIETGALRKNWNRIDISKEISNAADFYRPFAEEKGIEMTLKTDENLFVFGNRQLLSQSVINILDNAVKYTQKGGKINVSTKKIDDFITISICDNGQGVKSEYYDKITRKFFRLDESRTLEGNGLGLSLVKAAADLHKAKLTFKENKPGLCVILKFLYDSYV